MSVYDSQALKIRAKYWNHSDLRFGYYKAISCVEQIPNVLKTKLMQQVDKNIAPIKNKAEIKQLKYANVMASLISRIR